MQDAGSVAGVSSAVASSLIASILLAQGANTQSPSSVNVDALIVERFGQTCNVDSSILSEGRRLDQLGWQKTANENWPLYPMMRRAVASTSDEEFIAPADAFEIFDGEANGQTLRLILISLNTEARRSTTCAVEVFGRDASEIASAVQIYRDGEAPITESRGGQLPICVTPSWKWAGRWPDIPNITVEVFPARSQVAACINAVGSARGASLDPEVFPETSFVTITTRNSSAP